MTPGSFVNASMTGPESLAATRMSISPMVERIRRRLPAGSAATTPFTFFNWAMICCASGQARPRGMRPERRESASIPARIAASDFSPMPGRSRSLPALAAFSNCGSVVILSAFQIMPIFFGPRLGTLSHSARLAGTSFFSFSRNWSLPVRMQLVDLLGDGLADAGDLFELAPLSSIRRPRGSGSPDFRQPCGRRGSCRSPRP